MTHIPTHCLDWRDQFTALEKYFKGHGGVVHVHAGPDSAVSNFARSIRHRLEAGEWPFKWATVQIDPANANTHYLPDIIVQIRKNIELDKAVPDRRSLNVNVGNKNDAGGNVTISNVGIGVTSDEYERSMHESERIGQLCVLLRKFLQKQRLALIFVDSHISGTENLTNLGRKLWEGGLENLTRDGLVIIDIFNPKPMKAIEAYAWPLEPDLTIELPDRYDNQSRMHALDDLARIAANGRWFPTVAEAKAFASGIVDTTDGVRDVYARLAKAISHYGTSADAET